MMRPLLLATLLLALCGASAASEATATVPEVTRIIKLSYRVPADGFLFFRKELPPEETGPRVHNPSENQPVLPPGLIATAIFPLRREVRLRGTETAVERAARGFRLVDVPVERVGADRGRVVLRPVSASPEQIRTAIGDRPGGSLEIQDRALVLEGSAEWLHRAMHLAVVEEMRR